LAQACQVEFHVAAIEFQYSSHSKRCHGLAPWRFTLAANKAPDHARQDATGSSRGVSRLISFQRKLSIYPGTQREPQRDEPVASSILASFLVAADVSLHGTSPWH